LLGSRRTHGGGAPSKKTMRFFCWLKNLLQKFRSDVDRVISTGLGLKPKHFPGFRLRAKLKASSVGPHSVLRPLIMDSNMEPIFGSFLGLDLFQIRVQVWVRLKLLSFGLTCCQR
jgi:hypothetical protein